MKVNLISLVNTNKTNNIQNHGYKPYAINSNNKDVFVKSTPDISFTGNDKIETKNNLVDAMILTGVVGGGFLATVAAGAAMAKGQDPEQIFLSDGSYLCNASDLSIKSDKVLADADNGIFKVEGTGINIDPTNNNYDYFDVKRGVYKNFDGSVDIDLLHNKYIDTKNGIFVDEQKGFSLINDGDHFEYIGLPAFTSGYPTNDLSGWQMPSNGDAQATQDNFDKTVDYVKSLFSDSTDNIKDLFGREIITAYDNEGNRFLSAIPNNNSFKEFLSQGNSEAESIKLTNDNLLKSYMEEHNVSFDMKKEHTKIETSQVDDDNATTAIQPQGSDDIDLDSPTIEDITDFLQ